MHFNATRALRLSMPTPPSAEQGTILLWVKPDWETPRQGSKPLLTMRWNDSKVSYLAISEGWWEPYGAKQLYFVISNQEYAVCTTGVKLKPGYWTLLGVTWQSDDKGRCGIFINGERLADASTHMAGHYRGSGELVIGSDAGATDQRGRTAQGWVSDVLWLSRALTDGEMADWYARELGGQAAAGRHRWSWLIDSVKPQSSLVRTENVSEPRVLFDETSDWAKSPADADRILRQLKDAGFNVYVPCVWHGAGAYFPSRTTRVADELQSAVSSSDPLAYLLTRAHELGIEVHAWVTVAYRSDNSYPQYFDIGTPQDAYDIHSSSFRQFIDALIAEVFERYPVDGINLDYIRAMGVCSSGPCAQDYRARTGRNLGADIKQIDSNSQAHASVVDWQDQAVREIVESAHRARQQYRPHAILSVDGNVAVVEADRPLQGRNELSWLQAGLIDVVFDMNYATYPDIERLDQVMTMTKPYGTVIPLFANFDRSSDASIARPDWVVAKLAMLSRQRWPAHGAAFYMRTMLNRSQSDTLRSGPFRWPALPGWQMQATATSNQDPKRNMTMTPRPAGTVK